MLINPHTKNRKTAKMKFSFLLLLITANADKIIKNINLPSCRNCIYYQYKNLNPDFSSINKCEKFGEKDIVNGMIKYDYANSCRENESKCGKEGKYFEEDTNFFMKNLKFVKNVLVENAPFIALGVIVLSYFWLLTLLPKL